MHVNRQDLSNSRSEKGRSAWITGDQSRPTKDQSDENIQHLEPHGGSAGANKWTKSDGHFVQAMSDTISHQFLPYFHALLRCDLPK